MQRGGVLSAVLVHSQSWKVCSSRKRFHASRQGILPMYDLPLHYFVVFCCSET